MDRRDKYVIQHHKRRLAIASRYSLDRQRIDAERHLKIAMKQHRTIYILLMMDWIRQLENES